MAADASDNLYASEYTGEIHQAYVGLHGYMADLGLEEASDGVTNPGALAVDAAGNLYAHDISSGTIKEWNSTTRQVQTLVSVASTNLGDGLAVDGSGNVYFIGVDGKTIEEWARSRRTSHQHARLRNFQRSHRSGGRSIRETSFSTLDRQRSNVAVSAD